MHKWLLLVITESVTQKYRDKFFLKRDHFTSFVPHPVGIFYCSSNLMKVGLYLHLPIQNAIDNVRREIRIINRDTVFS